MFVCVSVTAGLLLAPLPAAPHQAPADVRPPAPFELVGGRPVVAVTINGAGPFKFILDSGAGRTVVSPALAAALKLPTAGRTQVGSPMGRDTVEADIVTLNVVEIAGVRVAQVDGLVLDVGDLMRNPSGPQGILSPASLPGYLTTIDFARQTFGLARGALPAPDGLEVFEYPASARLPTVRATIAGLNVDLHVDSGSMGFITLSSRLASALPLDGSPREVGRARTASGEIPILGASLKGDVRVGKDTLHNPALSFVDSDVDGNLGAQFLRNYAVTFDGTHRRIRLARSGGPVDTTSGAKPVVGRYGSFQGRYASRTVTVEGDQVFLQRDGGPRLRLVPAQGNEFTLEGLPPSARVRLVDTPQGPELHVLNPQGVWEIAKRQ